MRTMTVYFVRHTVVTGNASDAEDVLQTVFLRLLRMDIHSPGSTTRAGISIGRGSMRRSTWCDRERALHQCRSTASN